MTEPAPDPKHKNPFTRPGFILAASLILAIIAAAILIALWPRDTATPQPTPPPAAAAPTTPATDSKGTNSVCGLPSNEEMALAKAPESDWELLDGMAVPTAPETVGPGREAEELRTCFARTPTGALFAAANVLGALTSDTDPVEVIESLVADNDLRDEALAAAAASTPAPVAPEMQIAGFALERYTGTNATVELGIELENGAVGSITLPMVWESGDWKLLLEQSGPPAPVQRTDLSGLIPWNGV